MNLAPSDVPKDVYSDIVVLVEKERQKDAEGGGQDAAIAKILEGSIERKVGTVSVCVESGGEFIAFFALVLGLSFN